MDTPKKREKEGIEAIPTRELVRSVRKDLDAEAEKRLKQWEQKQAMKKAKKK